MTTSGSSPALVGPLEGFASPRVASLTLFSHPLRPQVRTQTLVKGAVVQIDAAPFRQWYQQHYGVEVGLKKGVPVAKKEGETPATQSSHVKRKLETRVKEGKAKVEVKKAAKAAKVLPVKFNHEPKGKPVVYEIPKPTSRVMLEEITAMAVSFLMAIVFFVWNKNGGAPAPTMQLVIGVAVTTASWIFVAFVTPPTDVETLRKFYQKIQPGKLGWGPVLERAEHERVQMTDRGQKSDMAAGLLAAACATAGIWALIFATGYWLYGQRVAALGMGVIVVIGGIGVARCWRRLSLR